MSLYAVVDPATGDVVQEYPTATDEQMEQALSAAVKALREVDFSAAIYEYYADNAEKFLADEPIDLLGGEGSALIRRSSVGLLIGIMPWNYPYYQVARFAGPNLTLGNTIILK